MYAVARRMRSSEVVDGSTPRVSSTTTRRAASASADLDFSSRHARNNTSAAFRASPLGRAVMAFGAYNSVSARPSRVSGSTNNTALAWTVVASIACGSPDGMITPSYSVHGSLSLGRNRIPTSEPTAIWMAWWACTPVTAVALLMNRQPPSHDTNSPRDDAIW